MNVETDKIRRKLLSVNDWKIKNAPEKRLDYEKVRKEGGKVVRTHADVNIIPIAPAGGFPNVGKAAPGKPAQRQTLSRFSKVFKKSTILSKQPGATSTEARPGISRKDEKIKMMELSFDKTYMNRVLWDEHVRMIYLRSGKINQQVLKQKPYLRLWMEALMNKISEKSKNLRDVLKQEITFLNNRYQVQRQLHFWQTLHSLTLDQLYHKKRQVAFKKRIRFDTIYEKIELLWKLFNLGFYKRVSQISSGLIIDVSAWSEENPNSLKFKILADLNYLRGLALMHMEKFETAYLCFKKDAELGEFANLKVCHDRSRDNIGRIHAIKGNFKQGIKLWTDRLAEVTEPKEVAWLYYGIAQCHALEENYDKAIEISNKCILTAEKSKSHIWELNGNLLIANCYAMLGMTRESNIRVNTLNSLRAINRAYQCAVFLANVSVIKKIMDIVVHIYNSFKDIDLAVLEDVWSPSLIDFARKADIIETDKNTDRKNLNLSNSTKFTVNKNSKTSFQPIYEINKLTKIRKHEMLIKPQRNSNFNPKTNCVENPSVNQDEVCVNVCCEVICERSSVVLSKEILNDSNLCPTSPITAVEVISSEEKLDITLEDEWITDSEYDIQ